MNLDPNMLRNLKEAKLDGFLKEAFSDETIMREQFKQIGDLLIEMLQGVDGQDIPTGFVNTIKSFVERWFRILNTVDGYKIIEDSQKNFTQKNSVIRDVNSWYDSIVSGFTHEATSPPTLRPYNFMQIYNWAKAYNIVTSEKIDTVIKAVQEINAVADFSKERDSIASFLKQAKDDTETIKNIANESRINAADQTFREYARTFNDQASKYSSYTMSLKPFRIKIGASEYWLIAGIILTVLFTLMIVMGLVNKILPVQYGLDNAHLISQIFTRLIAISIWIYLITFAFRQFTINRHLATINKHRANALNSYKLFTETIDKSERDARNALMLTVAKAIYDQGQTGYLSASSRESTSIVEMTRLVNQQDKSS